MGPETKMEIALPTFLPSSPPVTAVQRPITSVATSASARVNKPKYSTENRPALRPRMNPSTPAATIEATMIISSGTPSSVRLAAI